MIDIFILGDIFHEITFHKAQLLKLSEVISEILDSLPTSLPNKPLMCSGTGLTTLRQ